MKNPYRSENSISRRKFLGRTAAVAALTMVPSVISCKNAATTAPGKEVRTTGRV